MAGKGGAMPGGGRPAGSKNASTVAREEAYNTAIGPFKGTAKEFLQAAMCNPGLSASMRLDAAKTLIQYEEAKLSSVTIDEKRNSADATTKGELATLSSAELAKIIELGTPMPNGVHRKRPRVGSSSMLEQEAA